MSYIALRGLKRTTVADFSESLGVELTNAHHRMKRLVKLGVARKVSQKMPAEYEAN